jgi:hypothetical protein
MISRRDLDHAMSFAKELHGRALNNRDAGENAMGVIGSQAESGLAAFGYGALEGMKGPISVGPVSLDIGLATLLHAAGLFGLFGKQAGHAHNFAQGLADGYLGRRRLGVGAAYAQKHHAKTAGTAPRGGYSARVAGTNPRGRFAGNMKPLVESEIAMMTRDIR